MHHTTRIGIIALALLFAIICEGYAAGSSDTTSVWNNSSGPTVSNTGGSDDSRPLTNLTNLTLYYNLSIIAVSPDGAIAQFIPHINQSTGKREFLQKILKPGNFSFTTYSCDGCSSPTPPDVEWIPTLSLIHI